MVKLSQCLSEAPLAAANPQCKAALAAASAAITTGGVAGVGDLTTGNRLSISRIVS